MEKYYIQPVLLEVYIVSQRRLFIILRLISVGLGQLILFSLVLFGLAVCQWFFGGGYDNRFPFNHR